jgi:hypothetical protein
VQNTNVFVYVMIKLTMNALLACGMRTLMFYTEREKNTLKIIPQYSLFLMFLITINVCLNAGIKVVIIH